MQENNEANSQSDDLHVIENKDLDSRKIVLDSIGEDKESPAYRPDSKDKPEKQKENQPGQVGRKEEVKIEKTKQEAEVKKPVESKTLGEDAEANEKVPLILKTGENLPAKEKKEKKAPKNNAIEKETRAKKAATPRKRKISGNITKSPQNIQTKKPADKKPFEEKKGGSLKIFPYLLAIIAFLLVIVYFVVMFQSLRLILN
jgi:hypothetical protein